MLLNRLLILLVTVIMPGGVLLGLAYLWRARSRRPLPELDFSEGYRRVPLRPRTVPLRLSSHSS